MLLLFHFIERTMEHSSADHPCLVTWNAFRNDFETVGVVKYERRQRTPLLTLVVFGMFSILSHLSCGMHEGSWSIVMHRQITPLQEQAVGNSGQHGTLTARLRGRLLVFARICWLALAAFSLTAFVTGLPQYFTNLQEVCYESQCGFGQLLPQSAQLLQNLDISVGFYAVVALVLTIAITLLWFVVAGVIFWRKSDEWMALLVSLALVMFAGSGGFNTGLVWLNPIWNVCIEFLSCFGFLALFLVFFLFPNGRFAPRWMVLVAVVFAAFLVDAFLLPLIIGDSPFISWNWPFLLNYIVIIGLFGSLVFSQFYRYRRMSDPVQRQRTKWVIFTFIVVLLGFLGESLVFEALPHLFPAFSPPDPLSQGSSLFVWNIAPVLIPLSFGIAILRSHLWDIDIIINRTLVYGTLTISLALIYVGLIFALQSLLRVIINQNNAVAIVVSTLAIAALFQPLRSRIQQVIDRRFYRRKYDAAKTVEAFSATLRNEVDLNQLREHLITVVQDTMQPAHVSLWLRPTAPDRKYQAGREE
jgi:hypothetical protein